MRVVDATLRIGSGVEASPYCTVEVAYDIEIEPTDTPLDGLRAVVILRAAGPDEITEHGHVHPLELVLADEPIEATGPGKVSGRAARLVHRHVLDVDEDWWASDEDGQLVPIAEFRDRLIAQVEIRRSTVVAAARTNVFVGSFGPLAGGGADREGERR